MTQRFFLLFSRILEKGVMFLFFAILARRFGAAEFGKFSYFFSIASLLFVLFDNGGNLFQIPLFSKYGLNRTMLLRLFLVKGGLFLIVVIPVLLSLHNRLVLLLLIAFFLESTISIGRSLLFCQGQYIKESVFHIVEKLVLLTAVAASGLLLEQILFVYISIGLGKLFYIFLLVQDVRRLPAGEREHTVPWKTLFPGSWSYVMHAFLVAALLQFDIILLRQLSVPYEQIALYSSAIRIVVAVNVIPQILFNHYYPDVSRQLLQGSVRELAKTLRRARMIEWSLGLLVLFTFTPLAGELISMVYGSTFLESANVLATILPVILLRYSRFSDSAVISASEQNKRKFFLSGLIGLFAVGLNLLLIPELGIYGAACSLVAAEFFMWLGFRLIALKISPAVAGLKTDLMYLLVSFAIVWAILSFSDELGSGKFFIIGFVWLVFGVYSVQAYRKGVLR